jgi:response regulator RpfG family c-di-GMP phosphodiesterase
MLKKVLFVDDEDNVLSALSRQFRKHYEVSTALGGVRGLQLIASESPFAVIVSDMQMPKMDGVHFLQEARKLAPDSVRLMLTGNADQQTAMDAVNEGSVFSFLTKPCPPEVMVSSMKKAVEQYNLITAERELLEGTLNGSVKLLMDMLSMVAPESFGRAVAVREMACKLAKTMQLENTWDLELAAMLSSLACFTLPPETLAKMHAGEALGNDEQQMITRLPETGRNLIINIPRLERVAEIVLYHQKYFDGSGFPEKACTGEDIPHESRILKILCDLETLKAQDVPLAEALERMASQDGAYDPVILRTVSSLLGADDASTASTLVEVTLIGLMPGQVLVSNIETIDGKLLFAAGHTITPAIKERLLNYHQIAKIKEPIQVFSAAEKSDSTEAVAI